MKDSSERIRKECDLLRLPAEYMNMGMFKSNKHLIHNYLSPDGSWNEAVFKALGCTSSEDPVRKAAA